MDEEENVYGEEKREELVDDDEISSEEAGFLQGYDEADKEDDKEEGEDTYLD